MKPARPLEDYVLLVLGAVVLVLLGCGAGEPAGDGVLARSESQAVAGDGVMGLPAMVLPLPGPVVELDAPATVRVRLAVQLRAQAHYAAVGSAALQLSAPVATAADTKPLPLRPGPAGEQPLDYQVVLALPAGRSTLQARLVLRATDAANGLPTSALARAEAAAQWVVEVAP